MNSLEITRPYLLFLGDARDELAAKTAVGVYHWRPTACVGQVRLPGCAPRLDLPEMTIEQGAAAGAKTLLIGAANRGGVIAPSWEDSLVEALRHGLDIANGLHVRVGDFERVRAAAAEGGRRLHEVRHPEGTLPIGNGEQRAGHRLLTVGTDCSVGKMYTSLAIEKELRARGVSCDFRATGQTGILIDGRGVCIDAVVSDFLSGAIEHLCPGNDRDHWDVVEGQGSLFHPSFAGVSLGLLHGAQPDVLVLCHEPTRTHMRGLPKQPLPGLADCIEANLEAARLVSPDVRCAGVAVNTAGLDADAAERCLKETEHALAMVCVDPVRTGVHRLVDRLEV